MKATRATSSNEADQRWSDRPRYALPVVILVLFLALSALAFLRTGENRRGRWEVTYRAASQVFVDHIESHDPFDDTGLAHIAHEIENLCRYDSNITDLELLIPTPDGNLQVVAARNQSSLGRTATDIERGVAVVAQPVVQWVNKGESKTLELAVPVLFIDEEAFGCASFSVAAASTPQDNESMLFAVGFVLLLFAMVLYYFRQFRRMKAHYVEQDRTAVELRRLSAAVSQSANMIAITDVNGVIEYVNPRFCNLTGYDREEAIGQPSNLLKSGEHSPEFYAELWKTIESGRTWTGQIRNRRKNGDLYRERKTISPVFDDQGEIQHYLSVGEDITGEVRAQQKIIEKDKMSAVGMLAAGVAHEFKNYLGGIMGNASLALEDIDKPDGLQIAREALELVVDLSEKSNKVAMSLLTYSRARPEIVDAEDMRKIIEQSLSLVSKEMASRAIEVATYFEEAPRLNVSASKIQQLLLNLLINAAQAIKEEGVVTIALFNAGKAVKIVVGDSGSGIEPDKIGRVFDPFYSSKGVWGKDDVVGTGMGLSICRNIAREYGGDLTVESVFGIGTAFTLVLPAGKGVEHSSTPNAPADQPFRMLVYTLDKSIVSRLHAEASAAGVKLMMVDNIRAIPRDLPNAADLVMCDARFPAKGELLHAVDVCRAAKVPFATIYCEQLEYQIEEMREQSLKCFGTLPSISELIASLDAAKPERAAAKNRTTTTATISPSA